MWDTTGQEHYERLRPLSYGNADVFIICYDVARPSSYQNISSLWISEVNHYCPGIPVILVACKTDLRQSSENQIVSETATSETDETDDKTVSSKAIKFITTAEVYSFGLIILKFFSWILTKDNPTQHSCL